MGLYDLNFYDIIVQNNRLLGPTEAWRDVNGGRSVTFAQYRREVDHLAAGLQSLGVDHGDRIGVLAQNSLPFFEIFGAAAALGAVVVPVNWRLSAEEVVFNFNDTAPKVLFCDSNYHPLLDENRERLKSVQHIYRLDGPGDVKDHISRLKSHSDSLTLPVVDDQHDFIIIHTAAVEGQPRGAVLSHANVICANAHIKALFGTRPTDRHLNLLPLFHVAGLFMALHAFHAGALNVNLKRFDAATAVDQIAAGDGTIMFDFAPILGAILDRQQDTGADISGLRGVLGIEVPDTIERYQKVSGGRFYCLFGQTETSLLTTTGAYDDCPGAAGRPVTNGLVALFNNHDRPVATGEIGEIVMRGPMVFKGYWRRPEDNRKTFRAGWHHTGDLGRFDANGFLWYEGRKADKELIKPGGENVYPAEVEKVILEHPAVEAVVVFGMPDPKWKEGIKAVCRLKIGEELTAKALIDFVGARIARYKKPQYVEFVDVMPLLEDGMPDRGAVKRQYGGS
jgi:long-chain acyl-CoA synthetase